MVDGEKQPTGRILFADDDDEVLRPISRLLRAEGYDVHCVQSGDEAAQAMSDDSYDLLITDINMPGNRQLELLHSRDPETALVPVIVITGYPSVSTAVDALRLAVIDYMVKPLDPEELLLRVGRAIHKGRAMRAVHRAQKQATTWTMWLQSMQTALDTPGVVPFPSRSGSESETAAAEENPDILMRLQPHELESLSPREREVLREVAAGHRVGDVARALHISPHTVRNHLKSIFRKLDVNSQVALLGKLTGRARPTPADSN